MYGENAHVHDVYMQRKRKQTKQVAPFGEPHWRVTKMRAWRKYRKMTQQAVADALARFDPPVETTYVSIGRIERGLQKPDIAMIEAIAKVYRTKVDWMLNRDPKECENLLEVEIPKEVQPVALQMIGAIKPH